MKIIPCFLLLLSLMMQGLLGQIRMSRDSIHLSNAFIQRIWVQDSSGISTCSLILQNKKEDFSRNGSDEFAFCLNGKRMTGADGSFYVHQREILNRTDGQTLKIQLRGKAGKPSERMDVYLIFESYNDFPVIRKHIEIVNHTQQNAALTDLLIESLRLEPGSSYLCDVYAKYGCWQSKIPYAGDFDDAAILLHNPSNKLGMILGNESPGVLKRTEVYKTDNCIAIGMNPERDEFPFKYWLSPGEKFISPSVFIYLLHSDRWEYAFENGFQQFLTEKLGFRYFEHTQKPFLLYNTWRPFRTQINEKLILELAEQLEGTGTDIFIIDDGWMKNYGDWEEDKVKFPRGLDYACKQIRKKGMKPGLWFSFATVDTGARVVKEHPDWLIRAQDGTPECLHSPKENGWGKLSMSMASGWYGYMLNIVKDYVKRCELEYVKLDLSVITSAYLTDYERTGDYSFEGKEYRDRASSIYLLYKRTMDFMDELHKEFPQLYIDCTFETWGRYSLIDYALMQHAEFDWLTNYEEPSPVGPLSIRTQARQRARTIPVASMLIGNQLIDDPNYRYTFFSVAASNPILVGELDHLSADKKNFYRFWSSWFKQMELEFGYSRWFQTADIFDMPTVSNWDGCARFSKVKQGGILFFFRNDSPDTSRIFRLPWVEDQLMYRIWNPETGNELGNYRGTVLKKEGISIKIPERFSSIVLGIESLPEEI